jgi:hypothetical protein
MMVSVLLSGMENPYFCLKSSELMAKALATSGTVNKKKKLKLHFVNYFSNILTWNIEAS